MARPDPIQGEQRRRDLIASDPIGLWNAEPSRQVFYKPPVTQSLRPRFCIHVMRPNAGGAMQFFGRDALGCAQARHHKFVVPVSGREFLPLVQQGFLLDGLDVPGVVGHVGVPDGAKEPMCAGAQGEVGCA